jgi:hypothetical protein
MVNLSVWRLARSVNRHAPRPGSHPNLNGRVEYIQPVVFFNASTRLVGVSQNAAFALLAAAGLQMAGIPVIYFGCRAGMKRCVLGTRADDLSVAPPCKSCIAQASWLFSHAPTVPFKFAQYPALESALAGLDVMRLSEFEYQGLPLGAIVLPSIRWILRRHHLEDDDSTRGLFRDYIVSAFNVAQEFSRLLPQVSPRAVVVFNGMFFPEATVRHIAQEHHLPVITHEVGLRPFSAFFTFGQATAYPLTIPDEFQLSDTQNERLDRYLARRFKGDFSMAGIQFWKDMHGLGERFARKSAGYRQVIPVFTNVIFDTSQPHSNVVFEHMFAWLDLVVELAREYQDTLFIIRAHPDEGRIWKESRESVSQWVEKNNVLSVSNILFIRPDQDLSSYELIARSKFIMVYNSTIGLEASIMGVPVLCAGKARYTQVPIVFFPQTQIEYRQRAEEFLQAETIKTPEEFQHNARRFLYYQLFRSSLPFDHFIEQDGIWPGFVGLKKFSQQDLTTGHSPTLNTIVNGVLDGQDFILPEQYIHE